MAEKPPGTGSSFSRASGRAPRLLLAVVAVGAVAFVLWLVMFAPRLLVPSVSRDSLSDVADPAKRHELQDNRRQLEHSIQASREQHELSRQGQITERLTRAVDQLGHDSLDVRLGDTYALERIANDSPEDQEPVAEVLSAFVRGHAPWPPTRDEQPPADATLEAARPLPQRAPDVQAALTVLGRCERPRGGARRLDLTNTDLRQALLGDANLQYTDLTGARLQGADLYRAQLQGAKLVGGRLQGAYLVAAQLRDAMLEAPALPGVELEDAQLDAAQCSDKTDWPAEFDWRRAGVRLER